MLRRIVTVPDDQTLEAAWNERDGTAARRLVAQFLRKHNLGQRGVRFDADFIPVPLGKPVDRFVFGADFDNQDAVERFRQNFSEEAARVFADPEFCRPAGSVDCGDPAPGDEADVVERLGIDKLRSEGLSGKGVRIAVVDTCLDGGKLKVTGQGWSRPGVDYRRGSYEVVPEFWETSGLNHGTMCAMVARIAAPEASFLDYALLYQADKDHPALSRHAVLAFARLDALARRGGPPLVVLNPWGLFNRPDDEPVRARGNYSANPEHPLNVMVGRLAGVADVFFAAGNCGKPCPDPRCTGPDVEQSIHGVNAHPDVTTVAAVTTDGQRLDYSSQGPGPARLCRAKPDLAASSNFIRAGNMETDTGTSAACGVAAGICAALREDKLREDKKNAPLKPKDLKAALQRTAKRNPGKVFDHELGYGIINAAAALQEIRRPK